MKQIPLHGAHGIGKFAQVDDEDYEFLIKRRWFGVYSKTSCNYYVVCNYNLGGRIWTNKKMHHLVIGKKEGMVVDHIDGNGLNNQKSNLRHCTSSDNMKNKRKYKNCASEYKGVSKSGNKWISRIQVNGKSIYLGMFDCQIKASEAYKNAANTHFGNFVRKNQQAQLPPIDIKKQKEIIIIPECELGTRLIPLTKGKFAIVDELDYEWLSQWNWKAKESEGCYFSAYRILPRVKGETRKRVMMHNLILPPIEGKKVDHINRNPLDNRKCNLRLATPSQNSSNTRVRLNKTSSKYFGVFFHAKKWSSSITVYGKKYNLGRFPLTTEGEIEAALAYNKAAKHFKGEFAHINIIPPL